MPTNFSANVNSFFFLFQSKPMGSEKGNLSSKKKKNKEIFCIAPEST